MNKDGNRYEIDCSRVGNSYQLFGTRHYRLLDGYSDGSRCIDVRTGSGLEYTVVCDRGMDISLASFSGVNLAFLTENMEAHPAFYDAQKSEWLRTFTGGLLTTCGPCYLGDPCEDNGEQLGLHGRFSAIPARQVCDETDAETGTIRITGRITESHPFGHKLLIRRTISSSFGSSVISLRDEVRNIGNAPAPLTILYHVNFGYPLLNETADIIVPSEKCGGYDTYSEERLQERFHMKAPDINNSEKNYLHTFGDRKDPVRAWVWNKDLLDGLAAYVRFSPDELPYMTQWMLENVHDYVNALEPANVPCLSRCELRSRQMLPMIEPGQTQLFNVEIGFLHGNESIRSAIENDQNV